MDKKKRLNTITWLLNIFLIKEREEVRILLVKYYYKIMGKIRWNKTVMANDSICLQRMFDSLLSTKWLLAVECDNFCLHYHLFLFNHAERKTFPTHTCSRLIVRSQSGRMHVLDTRSAYQEEWTKEIKFKSICGIMFDYLKEKWRQKYMQLMEQLNKRITSGGNNGKKIKQHQ